MEGNCAICGEFTDLVQDHEHETGAWRGWLCGRCNVALGMFHDNPTWMRQGADYIDRHRSADAPEACAVCRKPLATGSRYCSRSCYRLARLAARDSKIVVTACAYCGTQFESKATQRRQYCSSGCYHLSQSARPQSMSRPWERCEQCGYDTSDISRPYDGLTMCPNCIAARIYVSSGKAPTVATLAAVLGLNLGPRV